MLQVWEVFTQLDVTPANSNNRRHACPLRNPKDAKRSQQSFVLSIRVSSALPQSNAADGLLRRSTAVQWPPVVCDLLTTRPLMCR